MFRYANYYKPTKELKRNKESYEVLELTIMQVCDYYFNPYKFKHYDSFEIYKINNKG